MILIVKKGIAPHISYYYALVGGLHRWAPDEIIAKQFSDRGEVLSEFNYSDSELEDSGFVLEEVGSEE